MTNTREEVAMRENARAWFIKCAQSLEEPPSCEESYVAGYQAALATRPDVNQELVERIAYLEKQLAIDSTDDDPFSYMSYADLKAENKVKDDNLYNLTRRNQGLVEALEMALFGGGMKHVSQQREKHAIEELSRKDKPC